MFSLRVEAFGVALAVGLGLGVLMSARLAEQARLDRAVGADVLVIALFGALFGARCLFALENVRSISFREALSLGNGGFSAYGAFFFAAVAGWYALRRRGQRVSAWFDIAAPGALLAAGVARLGSHLGAGDIGRPLPVGAPGWLVRLGHSLPANQGDGRHLAGAPAEVTHPAALYEALGALVLSGLLLVARRSRHESGDLALLAVFGYSILRVVSELARERAVLVLGVTPTEWYAFASAVLAAAVVGRRRQRQRAECST